MITALLLTLVGLITGTGTSVSVPSDGSGRIPDWGLRFHREAEALIATLPSAKPSEAWIATLPSGTFGGAETATSAEAAWLFRAPATSLDALARPNAVAPPDSLPDNMPLITRAFWGRHGLLRAVGLAPEHRAGELRARRRMLQWHQRFALVTFGAMTAQVITGQLVYGDPAEHYNSLQPVHRTLGYTTFGLYMTTASLSLGAPPARRYSSGLNSVKVHRYLALIHFAGMVAQPFLGVASARATDADRYNDLIHWHQRVGWITWGAYTASALTVLLGR